MTITTFVWNVDSKHIQFCAKQTIIYPYYTKDAKNIPVHLNTSKFTLLRFYKIHLHKFKKIIYHYNTQDGK